MPFFWSSEFETQVKRDFIVTDCGASYENDETPAYIVATEQNI